MLIYCTRNIHCILGGAPHRAPMRNDGPTLPTIFPRHFRPTLHTRPSPSFPIIAMLDGGGRDLPSPAALIVLGRRDVRKAS